MVGRELKNIFDKQQIPIGEVVYRAEKITSPVVKNVSFRLKKGEILGIAGLVGAGRTELFRAIFGLDKCFGGRVYLNEKPIHVKSPGQAIKHGIGFVTKDRRNQG